MRFLVSDEVTVKQGGPRMIVTGYSSGMVECRWYDGFAVQREAFMKANCKLVMRGDSKKPDV